MKPLTPLRQVKYLTLLLIVSLAACRPVKKVQRIGEVIQTKDTSTLAIQQPRLADSASIEKNIIGKLTAQRIDFTTFSAKVKTEYDGSEGTGQATVYLRMQKDSVIWLSLTGALGVEGFRILITPDSVRIMNKLDKVLQYRPFSYLQEITHVPINFSDLQDILLGNPVYLDSNVVSLTVQNNYLLVLMAGNTFKNMLTLDKDNFLVLHSKLDDIHPAKSRTADITYDGYVTVDTVRFATLRRISLTEKSKLDIDLEFKQYDFNKSESFPFSIPKSYKVR